MGHNNIIEKPKRLKAKSYDCEPIFFLNHTADTEQNIILSSFSLYRF